MVEYRLFGGKGGVGKTTCAAATALALGRSGRETLVVSTDPAHSLADAFETPVGDEPTPVEDGVSAVEIDPESGIERYRKLFEAVAADLGGAGIDIDAGDVRELFASGGVPGGDELAAIEAFAAYLESDWQTVIFDTAPTGHTLRLLDAPDAVGTGVRTAQSVRSQVRRKVSAARTMFFGPYAASRSGDDGAEFDELLAELDRVQAVLRDPDRTAFRVVCTPEPMVLAETERLVERLERFGVPVGAVVLNRVVTEPDPDCERCQAVADRQQAVLDRIAATFSEHEVVVLPDLTGVSEGREALDRLAGTLETSGLVG